ncbi:replication protein [Serratia fonticola]|uniref:replication protein n=1 Tax=Serratia fonticola TaxID=47917 RepID=UPI003AAAEDE5
MNTAEVIKFPGPEPGQEKRVADTDDGYTRLANELLEELIGANLTRNQAKVAFAVCRKTYGFNKKMDRIADSQIAALTKLPRQKVNKAKKELLTMGVLVSDGYMIGPNKNLEQWSLPQSKEAPNCHQNSDSHQDDGTVTKTVTKSVTKIVTGVSPEQGHTKDTITKEKKESIKPPKSPKGDERVITVFEFWKATHNHPTSKLDDKRRKRITARLSEGYPVDDLLAAISGALYDPWLMGKNPGNKRYDGIETLLRDAAQVERLRDLSGNDHAKAIAEGKYSAVTARNIQNLQSWMGSSEDTGAPF